MAMTKEQVIAKIEDPNIDPLDMEGSADLVAALIELGVIKDDGALFDVDLAKLAEYPDGVRQFVSGVLWTNDDDEKHDA